MKIKANILKFRTKKLSLFLASMVFFIGIIPTPFAYANDYNLIETENATIIPTKSADLNDTKFIKIKNGTINTRQIGEEGPSVVFETGHGDGLKSDEYDDTWNGIQDATAKYGKTISYDRFGIGKSSNIGNMPRLTDEQRETIHNGGYIDYNENDFNGQYKTARDKAINLHDLLIKAEIKKPYILVVHSAGSLTAIEFVKMYKNDVVGIVMLDGTFPDVNEEVYKSMKDNMPDVAKEFDAQFTNADGNMDEMLISGLQCKRDIKALENIPILYLQSSTTGMGDKIDQIRERCVSNMLSNSNFSKRIVVPDSQHYVHRSNPEFVNNAIKIFINERLVVNKNYD